MKVCPSNQKLKRKHTRVTKRKKNHANNKTTAHTHVEERVVSSFRRIFIRSMFSFIVLLAHTRKAFYFNKLMLKLYKGSIIIVSSIYAQYVIRRHSTMSILCSQAQMKRCFFLFCWIFFALFFRCKQITNNSN